LAVFHAPWPLQNSVQLCFGFESLSIFHWNSLCRGEKMESRVIFLKCFYFLFELGDYIFSYK
jgi:hypothetical protein